MRIKWFGWIIALLGLWEAADVLALFVPDFGDVPLYVWNHIGVGLIWIVVGTTTALAGNARLTRRLTVIALVAALWLLVTTLVLRLPVVTAGLWNDLIVGAGVALLSCRAIFLNHLTAD